MACWTLASNHSSVLATTLIILSVLHLQQSACSCQQLPMRCKHTMTAIFHICCLVSLAYPHSCHDVPKFESFRSFLVMMPHLCHLAAADNECGWRGFAVGLIRAVHIHHDAAAAGPALIAHMQQLFQQMHPSLLQLQEGWRNNTSAAAGLQFFQVSCLTCSVLSLLQYAVLTAFLTSGWMAVWSA